VAGGLVITGGNRTELLELAEEVLNQVAGLVQIFVVVALHFPVGLGRNHRRFAGLRQRFEYPFVGIVAFVGNNNRRFYSGQQRLRSFQITGLSGCQEKTDRIAEGIDGGVNFRAQPAPAASDRLVCPAFF
jgi:hypothetical protein